MNKHQTTKDIDYIHDSNPIVSKLLKLKYRINDVYRNGAPGLLPDKSDKEFVIGLINNIRHRQQDPSKIQLEECNRLWSKYAD